MNVNKSTQNYSGHMKHELWMAVANTWLMNGIFLNNGIRRAVYAVVSLTQPNRQMLLPSLRHCNFPKARRPVYILTPMMPF